MSKWGFTCNHEREVKSLLDWLAVHLVWQCRETHIFFVLVLKHAHKGEIIAFKAFINQSKHSYYATFPLLNKVNSTTKATLPSQSPVTTCCTRRKKAPIHHFFWPHKALFLISHNLCYILWTVFISLNTLQQSNNIPLRAELNQISPLSGFLGRAFSCYLIIVVRVKSAPGTLGPGGTDGGRQVKLHTSALR